MNLPRRTFLKHAFSGTALAVAAGAGLLRPTEALARNWPVWPAQSFHVKHWQDLERSLFGDKPVVHGGVNLHAPLEAENGAVVPMIVSTRVAGPKKLAIAVEKNPYSLATLVHLTPRALGFFNVRIKMGKTSPVRAYVETADRVHVVRRLVKVTIGGCGG